MSTEQPSIAAPVHAIVMRLLAIQLRHNNAFNRLEAAGVSLPADIEVDVLDLIADWYGVPEDNTVETNACDRANATGEWPEDAYCRDWIMDEWGKVEDGDASFDDFIAALCAA